MTYPDYPETETTVAGGARARGAAHGPSREARVRRSFDGVVASYIRDISLRHRSRSSPDTAGGPATSE
jgi:hypothetical protein